MGLIMFAGKYPGVRRVAFRGEAAPLADLKLLFDAGLGERGFDDFPPALSYLRPA